MFGFRKSTMEEPMTTNEKAMEKFEFLLGDWDMEYRIPKSSVSEADTGTGSGTFKRFLDDKYVTFDYSCFLQQRDRRMQSLRGMRKQNCIDSGGSRIPEISIRQRAIF